MPNDNRERLPPAVKGLSLVSLLNDFASEMVYPLLPSFVTVTLGAGAVALGALDGAADLAAAALRLVSGRLADRPGWRAPLILVGYGLALLVRPLTAVAGAAWQVIGFRVVDRIGKGLRSPARDALIADLTPSPLRGRAFGFHRAADHLGAVAGSLAAWLLLTSTIPIRQVLGVSAVPGVVAAAALLIVLRRGRRDGTTERGNMGRREGGEEGTRERRNEEGAETRTRVALFALAALAFLRMPEALLLLRLQDLGVGVVLVPLVWAGLHVVRSASAYPGGWLADRFGANASLIGGTLLYALMIGLLARPLGEAAAVALFLAHGLAGGVLEPAERAAVAVVAGGRPGRGFGFYQAMVGVASLPVAVGLGWVYQQVGGSAALGVAAVASVLAVVGWVGVGRGSWVVGPGS